MQICEEMESSKQTHSSELLEITGVKGTPGILCYPLTHFQSGHEDFLKLFFSSRKCDWMSSPFVD